MVKLTIMLAVEITALFRKYRGIRVVLSTTAYHSVVSVPGSSRGGTVKSSAWGRSEDTTIQ